MFYVYIPQSLKSPDQIYVGFTSDLEKRLKKHNAGGSTHTSKYVPWALIVSVAFNNELRALAFEKYLKTGSGKVFVKKKFL